METNKPARREHRRSQRVPLRRTIGYMAGISVALWYLAIELYPLWVKLGLSASSIFKLPIYAFGAGLAVGFVTSRQRRLREAVSTILASLAVVLVLWFFGMLLGAVGLVFGLSETGADWVMGITLVLGLLALAVLGLYVAGEEFAAKFRRRPSLPDVKQDGR